MPYQAVSMDPSHSHNIKSPRLRRDGILSATPAPTYTRPPPAGCTGACLPWRSRSSQTPPKLLPHTRHKSESRSTLLSNNPHLPPPDMGNILVGRSGHRSKDLISSTFAEHCIEYQALTPQYTSWPAITSPRVCRDQGLYRHFFVHISEYNYF